MSLGSLDIDRSRAISALSSTYPLIGSEVNVPSAAAAHAGPRSVTAVRVGTRLVRAVGAATTAFCGPVTAARVFGTWRRTLAEAKSLKRHAPSATVNDVIMTLIGGAVRPYLAGRNELPAETLAAPCPISIRTPGTEEVAGNHATLMMAPVRTDIEDPATRLLIIADATKSAKATVSALGPQTFAEVASLFPGVIGSP